MTPEQQFLKMMSDKLERLETYNERLLLRVEEITGMSKTHYVVPKAVTQEEADRWWMTNAPRFWLRDHPDGWDGFGIPGALAEFCNERAELIEKKVHQSPMPIAVLHSWQTPEEMQAVLDSIAAGSDDIEGVPV